MPAEIKKISIFLASLEGGGIQTVFMRLIGELIQKGYSTELIVINGTGPIRKQIPDQCKLVDLNCQRTRYSFKPMLNYIIKNKPLFGISAQTHLNVVMIILRMITGYPKRLVVTEHNTFTPELFQKGGITEKRRLTLIRMFYPLAPAVVAVSKDVADSIKKFAGFKKEIKIIHNGIDLERTWQLSSQPVDPRLELIVQKKPLIVGLGRLTAQKNFSLLLNAFSLLENTSAGLLIMGIGEEMAQLLALSRQLQIEDRLVLPGFIDNPYPLLVSADVFVLSSSWEGFCNVVIEALACGVPMVTTNCPGGPKDLLRGKPFARVVPMGDPQAMAEAIKEILELKRDKYQIIEFAKQFGISDIAQNYLDLLEKLDTSP